MNLNLPVFLQGLLLGLAIAAPVGPIGVLCIQRTLQNGRAAGFLSGLGATTADAFYGAVAAFGLTAVTGFLTLTNPATILSFALIFAGVGVTGSREAGWLPAVLLVLGVFVGSALWWFLLSGSVTLLRGRLTPNLLRWVNRAAGLIIGGFGALILLHLLKTLLTD